MRDKPTSLAELLVVEDDVSILEPRCPHTGIALWPLIRIVFNRMMMSDLLYGSPLITVGSATARLPLVAASSTLLRSMAHNIVQLASGRARAQIGIVTDALGVSQVDGRWFNRLSDYFALERPQSTLVIEEQWGWRWTMPRHVSSIMFHSPWQVNHLIAGKLMARPRHRVVAAALIDHVSERARRLLGWQLDDTRRGQLVTMLASKLAGLPHRKRSYLALLKRVAPRLLLVDSACYGTSAALLAAARELGVITAEFQHGAVTAGHDAYNVAPAMAANPAYREAMPEHFLSFGSWWSDQINLPINKVLVGSPHRAAQLRRYPRQGTSRRDVLLLGDGIETGKYLEFARAASAALAGTDWRVVFRPHPLERAQVAAVMRTAGDDVAIDTAPDIYEALARSAVVVSEQSSGLFEAIGLADRIFVWNTSKSNFGFPTHPFDIVDQAVDLAPALCNPHAGEVSAENIEAIWASDWQRRYAGFLQSCGLSE